MARVYVDFNEMVARDEVLLSKVDSKTDSHGNVLHFVEGMPVVGYMDDCNECGERDNLIADGVAIRNRFGHWQHVRWLLKINEHGVRHESDVKS